MDHVATSVEEMLQSARERDDCAGLIAFYRPYLLRFAATLVTGNLRTVIDPDDVVQEAALRCARSFDGFRGESEPELTVWLRRLVTSAYYDLARKWTGANQNVDQNRPLQPGPGDSATTSWFQPLSAEPTASVISIQGEWALRLEHAIAGLPEEQRDAVRLRFQDGQKLREVAESLGTTPAGVVNLLRSALKRLRKELGMRDIG